MEITLTPDQEALIEYGVERGRFKDSQEAVRKALALWEEVERDRMELLLSLDQAEAEIAAGNFIECDEEGLRELAEQIKREGRMRRAALAS
jgi:Arc/MetJ-type ribon-helix-helix transcriptional regulator